MRKNVTQKRLLLQKTNGSGSGALRPQPYVEGVDILAQNSPQYRRDQIVYIRRSPSTMWALSQFSKRHS